MSRKKKLMETEPLLYIVQPKLRPPTASMQQSFVRRGRESVLVEKEEEQQPFEPEWKPSFSQMTVPEQLAFLASLPSHLPPVKCLLETKSTRPIEGIVTECEEGRVKIATNEGERQLNADDVRQVILIGWTRKGEP
ncbi:CotO family spore coat protein [Caldibacillus thermoamylovorans]